MTSLAFCTFFSHMLRWATACHLHGVERGWHKLVLFTLMVEYSKQRKWKEGNFPSDTYTLSHPTFHIPQQTEKHCTDLQEGGDRQFQAYWKSLVSVDRGLCHVCKVLFASSFFFFFSQTAQTCPDTPHMFIYLTCHLFSCDLELLAVLTLVRDCLYCFTQG